MPAQDDHKGLTELAERLGLDDDERESFVTSGMKRLGYKPRTDWDEPDNDDKGKGGGDFFSSKRSERERRQVRPDNSGRGGSGRGSDWQYGG